MNPRSFDIDTQNEWFGKCVSVFKYGYIVGVSMFPGGILVRVEVFWNVFSVSLFFT